MKHDIILYTKTKGYKFKRPQMVRFKLQMVSPPAPHSAIIVCRLRGPCSVVDTTWNINSCTMSLG